MLNNVLQVFIVYQMELCHDVWIDFRWTQGHNQVTQALVAEQSECRLMTLIILLNSAHVLLLYKLLISVTHAHHHFMDTGYGLESYMLPLTRFVLDEY